MQPDSSALIRAADISIIRNGKALLDRVSLDLHPGQHVTIVGPNGAGKTLLLKTILGLMTPTSGTVTRKAGTVLGYMPQRMTPNPLMPMTVTAFLNLLPGASRDSIRSALDRAHFHVDPARSIHALSGGEWQRVLLARALLRKPDILLLDEPGQNLDVPGQLALYELIREIQQEENCAVLVVSHDLHFVMRRTDQVICLFRHVCCTGKPQEIVAADEFKALFGESIGEVMGFYPHHHAHSHDCANEHFPNTAS